MNIETDAAGITLISKMERNFKNYYIRPAVSGFSVHVLVDAEYPTHVQEEFRRLRDVLGVQPEYVYPWLVGADVLPEHYEFIELTDALADFNVGGTWVYLVSHTPEGTEAFLEAIDNDQFT